MSKFPDGAVSSEVNENCEACKHFKKCRMYITQMGTTAWICKECWNGTKKRDN